MPPLRRIVRYQRVVGVAASPHAIVHQDLHIRRIAVVLRQEVFLHHWPVLSLLLRQCGVPPLMKKLNFSKVLPRGEEVAGQVCTLSLVPKADQHSGMKTGYLGIVLNRLAMKLLTGHCVP